MDELQAGIKLALMVFPQPSVLFQPGKTAFDNPAHHHKRVQLTAFGDFHSDALIQYLFCSKGLLGSCCLQARAVNLV